MLGPKVFEHLSNQASAFSCPIISGASTVQLVTAKARRFGANYGSLGQMRWVLRQTRETWIFDQMLESRNSLKWMPELLIWSFSVVKRNFVPVIWLSYPWHETRYSRWANVGSQNLPKPPLEVILFGGWRDGAGTHQEKVWLLLCKLGGPTLHFFLHVNAIEEVKEIIIWVAAFAWITLLVSFVGKLSFLAVWFVDNLGFWH